MGLLLHFDTRLRVRLDTAQRAELLTDASGDRIDAALCLLQAAWASARSAEVSE